MAGNNTGRFVLRQVLRWKRKETGKEIKEIL